MSLAKKWFIAIVVVLLAGCAFCAWWFYLRPDGFTQSDIDAAGAEGATAAETLLDYLTSRRSKLLQDIATAVESDPVSEELRAGMDAAIAELDAMLAAGGESLDENAEGKISELETAAEALGELKADYEDMLDVYYDELHGLDELISSEDDPELLEVLEEQRLALEALLELYGRRLDNIDADISTVEEYISRVNALLDEFTEAG
jgi:hypothetical protein